MLCGLGIRRSVTLNQTLLSGLVLLLLNLRRDEGRGIVGGAYAETSQVLTVNASRHLHLPYYGAITAVSTQELSNGDYH